MKVTVKKLETPRYHMVKTGDYLTWA